MIRSRSSGPLLLQFHDSGGIWRRPPRQNVTTWSRIRQAAQSEMPRAAPLPSTSRIPRSSSGSSSGERPLSLGRAARFGSALALGALAFAVVAGAVLVLGAGGLFAGATFTSRASIVIRTATGVLLVLGLLRIGLARPDALGGVALAARPLVERAFEFRRRRPMRALCFWDSAICSRGLAEPVRSWPVWAGGP